MWSNVLDPIYSDISVVGWGGLYNEFVGIPNNTWDISHLLQEVRIYDSIHEAGRRAEFTFENEDVLQLLGVQSGSRLRLWGHRMEAGGQPSERTTLFVGQSFEDIRKSRASSKTRTYSVYDMLTWLSRNEHTLTFKDQSLTEVFNTICSSNGIPQGTVVDTGVKVGQIIMGPGYTYWDAIQEATKRTLRKTGRRYFVRAKDDGSALELLPLGQTGVTWHVYDGQGGTLESIDFRDSAQNLRTRVTVVVQDTDVSDSIGERYTVKDSRTDTGYGRKTFGILAKVVTPDASEPNPSNIEEQLTREFARSNRGQLTASTDGLLLPGVRRGDLVKLTSQQGGFNPESKFYVETVVSEYREDGLRQNLELVFSPEDTA